MSHEVKSQMEGQAVHASFWQKSAGVSFFIIGSAALYYAARVWPMSPFALTDTSIPEGYAGLVLTTLGLIVVAEIVLQIVLVIGAGSAGSPTIREKEAALKATRNAYAVLIFAVLAIVAMLFVGFPAFGLANLAMLSLLMAEITRFASQLFYSRQSAQDTMIQKRSWK